MIAADAYSRAGTTRVQEHVQNGKWEIINIQKYSYQNKPNMNIQIFVKRSEYEYEHGHEHKHYPSRILFVHIPFASSLLVNERKRESARGICVSHSRS